MSDPSVLDELAAPSEDGRGATAANGTLLIVDDVPDNLKLMIEILTPAGYRVCPADSGELAIDSAAAVRPDLILLDVLMPGVDGFEICRRFKANAATSDVPIIFISGHDDAAVRVKGFAVGGVDFITKPIHDAELLARVRTHVELHRLRAEMQRSAAEAQAAKRHAQQELALRVRSETLARALNADLRASYVATLNLMDDAVAAKQQLETALEQMKRDIEHRKQLEEDLGERIKELRCLYTVSNLLGSQLSVDEVLQGSAEAMPAGFLVPGAACARIVHNERAYATGNYRSTPWRLSSDIIVQGRCTGQVEVCYLQELPARDDGPFLREERALLDAVAERIGKYIDRLHMSRDLRENEEMFSLFLQHSPIFAYIKEVSPTESRVLRASDNFDRMVGVPGPAIRGNTMEDLFPPDLAAKMTADDWAVVSKGDVLELEEELNGRHYASFKFPIVQGDRTLLAGYTIDITERREAEAARVAMQAQLLQAQKMESIGLLAGGVAHDFNNMLSAIIGYADLTRRKLGPESPVAPHVDEIRKAAERSANLTRQLLLFARKEVASLHVLDINAIIAGSLKLLRRMLGEDMIVDWVPQQDVWRIAADETQIEQVLANLAINARDAMRGNGGGALHVSTANAVFDAAFAASHAGVKAGEFVRLRVRDTGVGMDSDTLARMFEPFFTTKRPGEGTGLGLSTVFGIVRQHEGFIDVASAVGKGTTFDVYFPRSHAPAKETTHPKDALPRGTETVLLTEDDELVRAATDEMLRGLGYTVLSAPDGAQALALATSHPSRIHLLLTDVIMPGMNGAQLRDAMLRLRPDVKVLFMSGYPGEAIAEKGVLRLGIHFLQKPFSLSSIAAAVREALDE